MLIECTVNLKIISATRFVIVPNLPPKDACQENAIASPRLRRWRRGARWARRKLARAPRAARIVGVVAILLGLVALTNLVYHVIRKPTELFAFVGDALDKEPAETWRQYGPLFRAYSTNTITPELLAALAQVESSGNPVARTYWRWRLSLNPFAIYRPASSAVGLFQMTDAAYAEAARSCVREMRSQIPAAGSPASLSARSRAMPLSSRPCIWPAMSRRFSPASPM